MTGLTRQPRANTEKVDVWYKVSSTAATAVLTAVQLLHCATVSIDTLELSETNFIGADYPWAQCSAIVQVVSFCKLSIRK